MNHSFVRPWLPRSYLGFGSKAARAKILAEGSASSSEGSPCVPLGVDTTFTYQQTNYTVGGCFDTWHLHCYGVCVRVAPWELTPPLPTSRPTTRWAEGGWVGGCCCGLWAGFAVAWVARWVGRCW